MTERPSTRVVDLHGAITIYAGLQALLGISARAGDLLWSDWSVLRAPVDLVFGYGLALLLLVSHAGLRWRPLRAVSFAFAALALLASMCASQLLAALLSLPPLHVYEGDSLITLLASALALAGLAPYVPRPRAAR